jgi:hypothetical protein
MHILHANFRKCKGNFCVYLWVIEQDDGSAQNKNALPVVSETPAARMQQNDPLPDAAQPKGP